MPIRPPMGRQPHSSGPPTAGAAGVVEHHDDLGAGADPCQQGPVSGSNTRPRICTSVLLVPGDPGSTVQYRTEEVGARGATCGDEARPNHGRREPLALEVARLG